MIDPITATRIGRASGAMMRQSSLVAYLRLATIRPGPLTERFHVVFYDAFNRYLSDGPMGQAGQSRLSVRLREVFKQALSLDAYGLLIAHNHPSGDCRPSAVDIDATQRLKRMAIQLDIELIDHLIFTERAVYSMRAGGKL